MNRKYRITIVILIVVSLLIGASAQEWRSTAVAAGDQQLPGSMPAGAAAPGFGSAPEALTLVPVPGGPAFYSLAAWAFKPDSSDGGYTYWGGRLVNTGASQDTYMAEVTLPNGATVNRFVVFFYDNHSTVDYNLTAVLRRYSLATFDSETMAQVASSDNIDEIRYVQTTSITSPVIDQQSYTYAVEVLLPVDSIMYTELFLRGVRIDYGYPVNLPLVRK
jgi:hypothetical protein